MHVVMCLRHFFFGDHFAVYSFIFIYTMKYLVYVVDLSLSN
jgi:hypothetical protein